MMDEMGTITLLIENVNDNQKYQTNNLQLLCPFCRVKQVSLLAPPRQ